MTPCAMHGGDKAAQEAIPAAVELAGSQNGVDGSGAPRGEGKGRPQVGEKEQGGPRRLVGAPVGGLGQPSGRETGVEGRRRRPCFPAEG